MKNIICFCLGLAALFVIAYTDAQAYQHNENRVEERVKIENNLCL